MLIPRFHLIFLLPHVSESSILHVFSCCILDVFRLFIRSRHHFPIRSVVKVKHSAVEKWRQNMHQNDASSTQVVNRFTPSWHRPNV